ncbi:hypothetical protein JMJ35_002427 [Cladonia borealis]|uniref:Protein BFR2 n=1 Tax=Cladonia borealis TaxID=184061 RepID=A0AA39R835_9LECA|nr:hypothetical protein JMJ35_002427 [Cladonia borealis]
MAEGKPSKSWAEQLKDLEDPAPKDFDPEDQHQDVAGDDASGSASDGDSAEAREHYVDVGKSDLRKSNSTVVGPQYKGSSISREALLEDESDDDPFAKYSEQEDSGDFEYVDPEGDLEEGEQDEDEEIDSDEAFESGDDEKFGIFTFRGSKSTREGQDGSESANHGRDLEEQAEEDALEGGDEQNSGSYTFGGSKIVKKSREEQAGDAEDEEDVHADEDPEASADEFNGVDSDSAGQEDDGSDIEMTDGETSGDSDSENTSMSAEPDESKADDRAALRKMMAEEQKTVAASLYKAAKADVAKGRAIKNQRSTFDSLLNTRIKLQKALISTNSMSASSEISTNDAETILAAESAALNLWNTISALRSSLHPPNSNNTPFTATPTTPSPTVWENMQHHESLSLPPRRTTLTKWSQKTAPPTTLPRPSKFSQTPTHQPLTTILDTHLTGPSFEKLLHKTHIPRSCAPIQAASSHIPSTDPHIYDDADFYTLLLRELVDQRMADNNNAPVGAAGGTVGSLSSHMRDFKVKKVVDTKASKGRKMRYTVHEKLQNFMAAEDRGGWGERQRGELFGSLLGRRVKLGEDEVGEEGSGEGDMEGGGDEEGGLRLFG